MHRATWDASRRLSVFAHPAVTVFGPTFQKVLLTLYLPCQGPATPVRQVLSVWAVPLSLATTDGIASLSVPVGTEMFHFPTFCSAGRMYSGRSDTI